MSDQNTMQHTTPDDADDTGSISETETTNGSPETKPKVGFLTRFKNMPKGNFIAIIGVMIGVMVPVWQIYFVEQPDIYVEIGSLNRLQAGDFKTSLDIGDLKLLKRYVPAQSNLRKNTDGIELLPVSIPTFSIPQLEKMYQSAELELKNIPEANNRLEDNIKFLNEYVREIETGNLSRELRVNDLQKMELAKYISPAALRYYQDIFLKITHSYIDVAGPSDTGDKNPKSFNAMPLKNLLMNLQEDLSDSIKRNKVLQETLRANIRDIDNHITRLKDEEFSEHTYFKITASVSNSGRVSTSLKRLALARIYIGIDNYVDLELAMDNYKENAEIPPNATKVIAFSSDKILSFPKDDRKLLNQYWGQSVNVVLFTMDITEEIYKSNAIAFSAGLNNKLVIDSLKKEANQLLH